MKNWQKIGIAVGIMAAGCLVYYFFLSDRAMGNRVFSKIESGRLQYTYGLTNKIVMDFDDITTLEYAKSILIGDDGKYNINEVIEFAPTVFDIPNGIRRYKYIDSKSFTTELNKVLDVSKADYEKTFKKVYPSYSDYVNSCLKTYASNPGFKYDSVRQIIFYQQIVDEKRLTYAVELRDKDVFTDLVFLKLDGKYKLAGIINREK